MFSVGDGRKLLKAARGSVVSYFSGKSFRLAGFPQKLGVFVTIHSYPSRELRGCIGFPEPVFSLNDGLPKAALAAAFSDPRFPPLEEAELGKVIFEVSILTKPSLIKVVDCKEYLKQVNVGSDGLIVDNGSSRGLLLPIVASEYGWDARQFLCHACMKAGLPSNSWEDVKSCKVFKFQAQVFSESKPF